MISSKIHIPLLSIFHSPLFIPHTVHFVRRNSLPRTFCHGWFLPVGRLPSVGPVLRHTDRKVWPAAEGAGSVWWLHPVLYCTSGESSQQNVSTLTSRSVSFIVPPCSHITAVMNALCSAARITTKLLRYSGSKEGWIMQTHFTLFDYSSPVQLPLEPGALFINAEADFSADTIKHPSPLPHPSFVHRDWPTCSGGTTQTRTGGSKFHTNSIYQWFST